MRRVAIAIFSLCSIGACDKQLGLQSRVAEELQTPSTVLISYPAATDADPLNLRECPLSGQDMPCRMMGTAGRIKKISWPDMRMNITEATVRFDAHGHISEICQRGHSDFAGGGCSTAPFSRQQALPQTVLDEKGRLLRRQHDQFDSSRIDTCSYQDDLGNRKSECNDGFYIIKFTYDDSGRALTYSRRVRPEIIASETPERAQYIQTAEAVDLVYDYKNDKSGNWIEMTITSTKIDKVFQPVHVVQTRTIEYY